MSIEEDYVTLEQAKMLKDKGFDGECFSYYYRTPDKEYKIAYDGVDGGDHWNSRGDSRISRPTHQMVLKWFREVHGIMVTIDYDNDPDSLPYERWGFSWYAMPHYEVDIRTFATHEAATSAAIDDVLTNLI